MRSTRFLVLALLLALLLAACAPNAATAPAPQAPAAPATARAQAPAPATMPAASAKPAWQAEWERVLTEARKEGRVMLTTALGAQVRAALTEDLKNTYGLATEAVAGSSGQNTSKILAERRAGLYLRDVYTGGTTSPYIDFEPVGVIDPLDSALILPDVTDRELIKKTWYGGDLWWVDSNHLVLAALMGPYPPLAINTNLVKPGDIKSYNDLLDPKWKGKMNINDPSQARTTFSSFIMNLDGYGADWLRKLVKQEPIIMADERLQGDWLAHGKVAIALGIKDTTYMEFKTVGAPVQVIIPAEGTWLSTGSSAIYMLNKAPHPNAAKVFVNWYLSKEAQTTLSRLSGGSSTRQDVPTDFLEQWQVRQSGVKYWEKEKKDINLRKAEEIKIAKEIFAPMYK